MSGALAKVGRYRWTICALLFFATTINYIDRQVLGILGPTLQRDLGWNEQQFGDVVSWFTIAYALGFLFAGRIMDRFGTRRGFAGSIVVWSLSAMAHGARADGGGFSAARFALGLGESGNFPASIKTVAEWFPSRERAFATGIFNAGSNVGAIITPILVPWIALQLGMARRIHRDGRARVHLADRRGSLIYRPPERASEVRRRRSSRTSAAIRSSRRDAFAGRELLRHRQTWAFAIGKLMTDPIWWFYLYWLPKFLDARYGIKLAQIAAPLIVIYLLADVGSVFGGWLSGAFIKRGWSVNAGRKTTMLIAALVIVPTMFAPDGDQHVGRGGDRRRRRGGAPMVVREHLHADERHVPAVRRRLGRGDRRILRRGRRRVVPARHGLGAAAQRQQLHADLPRLRHSRTSPRWSSFTCWRRGSSECRSPSKSASASATEPTMTTRRDFLRALGAGAAVMTPLGAARVPRVVPLRRLGRPRQVGGPRVGSRAGDPRPDRAARFSESRVRHHALRRGGRRSNRRTRAIGRAIAACASAGGGRVVVPAGRFATGPIHLRSNVNLHVSRGATLVFARDSRQYLPAVLTRFEGTELMNYSPFIYALDQQNIAITGEGTLDGQADSEHWWPWKGSGGFRLDARHAELQRVAPALARDGGARRAGRATPVRRGRLPPPARSSSRTAAATC